MKPKETTELLAPGLIFLGLSLAVLPVAALLHSGPMLVLGLMGAGMVLAARLLGPRPLRRLALRRTLPPRTFAGASIEIAVEATHGGGWLPLASVRLRDRLAHRRAAGVSLPRLESGEAFRLRYRARLLRRGIVRENRFDVESTWPFGFFAHRLSGRFLVVYPKTEEICVAPNPVIPRDAEPLLARLEGETALFSRLACEEPNEFRSLREFRPGDPLKSIHWPSTTRSTSLMVREFDPPRPGPRRRGLYLHQFAPSGVLLEPDRFEQMLRLACGLLLRTRRQRIPLAVRLDIAGSPDILVPEQASFGDILDLLTTAVPRPTSDPSGITAGWDFFSPCDHVLLLGCWHRLDTVTHLAGLHPSVFFLDPPRREPGPSVIRRAP